MNLIKLIDGHKTQIGAVVTLIIGYAIAQKWIDAETGKLVLGILTIWQSGAIVHHEYKAKAGK